MSSTTVPPAPDPGPCVPAELSGGTAGPLPGDVSAVRRLWGVFRREPLLLVTCSYLFISVYGLWDSYWYYRRFEIPILEFMQSSDYFVSGLRRPEYAILLAWTLLASWAALWPERWRQRNPDRVPAIERRWWGRLLLPRRGDWWAYMGLHPETMATLVAAVTMVIGLYAGSTTLAKRLHDGAGHAVSIRMDGQSEAMSGEWRMLGTSSAFVFVWNPVEGRAEALPIDSVQSMRLLGWRSGPAAQAQPTASGPTP